MSSSSIEKRLVLRILAHWREIQDGRAFPTPEEFQEEHLGDDARYCFRLVIPAEGGRPVISSLGAFFLDHLPDGMGRAISDVPSGTLLAAAAAYSDDVIKRRVPVSLGGTALHGGVPVLFRSILLPLSRDGEFIDQLLGAANCRPVEGDAWLRS